MTPPQGPPPCRPGSKPDIVGAIAGDEQPDRVSVNHDGVDGAPQRPPKRTATLPQMAALRAPPLFSQPDPPLPVPPSLPGEHAPTVPVPNPLQRLTVRRPTPPSAMAQARRSVPPSTPESPATASPATGQPGVTTSLPPASQDPDSATHAALRRELAKAQAATEAQAAETKRLELELAAKALAEEQAAKKAKPDPEKFAGLTLRQAFIGLIVAVTALGTPLGIYLTAKASSFESKQAKEAVKTEQATQTAASAKVESTSNDKELAALRVEVQQLRVNLREVLRLQGIKVPKTPGDPDPADLEPTVPLREDGKVQSGPTLILGKPL